MLERVRFRRWWRPPRLTSERPAERRVTFLELFYDLVYVVIISELSHALAGHIDPAGIGTFIFLAVIVWWAWFNGAMYHDMHGNNDIRTRVFTFLQMFTVAAMAVFAHRALGPGAAGFALAYAVFHLILTWLWWRTGVFDPNHRPLSQPYAATFLFTSLLFVISVFVPTPWCFILWGLSVLTDLILLLALLTRTDHAVQEQLQRLRLVSPSAVERFGLFTIIVLGEVLVGVVGGVAGHEHLTWTVGATAALGMTIGIGLWWIYFDFISSRPPGAAPATSLAWVYLHLPVAVGIAAVGAGVLNAVEHAGQPLPGGVRWLLTGAVATVLVGIALIMRTLEVQESYRRFYRNGALLTSIAALPVILLGLIPISAIPLLLALALLLLAPVVYGVLVWIKVFDARELQA